MAKRFRYRGEVYDVVKGATLGELRTAERHLQTNFSDFTTIDASMTGYYVSIRRGQLANGITPLVTMDELMECTLADFETIEDTAEPLPPAAPEVPESEWPLDPKDDATPTEVPVGYDPPPSTMEKAWTTPVTSSSGSSPRYSVGHLLP